MKGIIFSASMVQAILDGRKSMTRRVIKGIFPEEKHDLDYPPHKHDEGDFAYHFQTDADDYVEHRLKPRYQTGDILWVRETWADESGYFLYRADDTSEVITDYNAIKWRPSIFMPREAARIFLKVTEVRVERVQDITNDDAREEGALTTGLVNTIIRNTDGGIPRTQFHILWDSINAKRGYGWDTNPWVWVYSFDRIDKESEGK